VKPICENADMPPKSDGLLESSLYVKDVAASAQFFAKIFGFRMVSDFGERGCAMQADERQVLLLFKKGGSLHIPSPQDGYGELHIAFAIPASELVRWRCGLRKTESSSKRSARGIWVAEAYAFGIPTAICWKLASPGVWSTLFIVS
jgi:catechol 2,3-dioxygenase-like lactoylglutathione lyase family enzyme